ncbi:alpha-hydroxy acid oxidase [Nonomuraea sp. NPDC048882]|uniref:alpha-hydroxy acid oxidase n=1 Tax=Nonomuraea sp. NPDC048882 TaxID=3154347 RepID=UPI0033E5B1D6
MTSTAYLNLDDYEAASRRHLPEPIWTYLSGGAGRERTISANREAFSRWCLLPAPLDSQAADPIVATAILGQSLDFPVILAPTSPQRLFHPDAELASAAGARESGTISIVSTDSQYPLRDIGPEGDFWFQLYCYGTRDTTKKLLHRAESAGATAIVVTVDNSFEARRISLQRSEFGCPDDVEFGILREIGYSDGSVPVNARLPRRVVNWDELAFIQSVTSLPMIVKGIARPSDARRLVDRGVAALIVSNHGGRQLDDSVATLDALVGVVSAVNSAVPVLMDGGVRSGLDVIKAMALGATAVCIGRPYVWGLSLSGVGGVQGVLGLMKAELVDGMRQLGKASILDLGEDLVRHTG